VGSSAVGAAGADERQVTVINSGSGLRLEIYFAGWSFVSVTGPTAPDTTRRLHALAYQTGDAAFAEALLRQLPINALRPNPLRREDGRQMFGSAHLVIDVIRDGDQVETFFSDGCNLFGLEGKVVAPVGDAFRRQFALGVVTPFDEVARCAPWQQALEAAESR
jgi:hypothetical protein